MEMDLFLLINYKRIVCLAQACLGKRSGFMPMLHQKRIHLSNGLTQSYHTEIVRSLEPATSHTFFPAAPSSTAAASVGSSVGSTGSGGTSQQTELIQSVWTCLQNRGVFDCENDHSFVSPAAAIAAAAAAAAAAVPSLLYSGL